MRIVFNRWKIQMLIIAICWFIVVFGNTPIIAAQSIHDYFYDEFVLPYTGTITNDAHIDSEKPQNEISNNEIQHDSTQILPTDAISIHYHSYTTNIIAPSCENDGYTIHTCSCGDSYNDNYISKLSHSFTDWTIENRPTVFADGKKVRSCTLCGKQQFELIPMIPGKSIHLKENVSINSVLTQPCVNDFQEYIGQAEILYEIILNGNAGEHNIWPSGIYGPSNYAHIYLPIEGINDLSDSQKYTIASKTVKTFIARFNQNVLHGVIWVNCGMWDIIDGGVSIHFDPSELKSRLDFQFSVDYKSINLKAGLVDGMSEIDAINLINQWICDNISYNSGSDPYTVLNSKQAQCAGYASLFYMMCQNASIDCQYIIGCIDGNSNCRTCHAWNRVKVNDKWYWVDVCWNDTGMDITEYLLDSELWEPRLIFD